MKRLGTLKFRHFKILVDKGTFLLCLYSLRVFVYLCDFLCNGVGTS
jgi:hypothetical protein